MVEAFDVPPPGVGLKTVMFSKAPVATSAAEMAACNWLGEMKVVGRGVPFSWTTEDEFTKPVPFTVSVKAGAPARTELGFKDAMVGAGSLMVSVEPPDVPPPGEGLTTVIAGSDPLAISAAVMLA